MDNPTHLQSARVLIERNQGFHPIGLMDLRNAIAYVVAHLEQQASAFTAVQKNLADHEQLLGELTDLADLLAESECAYVECAVGCGCADDAESAVADELHEMIEDAIAAKADVEVTTQVDTTSGVMRHHLSIDWVD